MKRKLMIVLALLVPILLATYYLNRPGRVLVDLGPSELYTAEELEEAASEVMVNFSFPACRLERVYYEEEKSLSFLRHYEGGGFEDLVVIMVDFVVDFSGENPVLIPGATYEGYHFILGKNHGKASWQILDWGY